MKAKFNCSFKYMVQTPRARETTLEWFKEWVIRSRIMMPYHKGEIYGWK